MGVVVFEVAVAATVVVVIGDDLASDLRNELTAEQCICIVTGFVTSAIAAAVPTPVTVAAAVRVTVVVVVNVVAVAAAAACPAICSATQT